MTFNPQRFFVNTNNMLYLSSLLKTHYPTIFEQIKTAFQKFDQKVALLPYTNDIWVRDFMPIPLPDGTLLEYCYDPDYLQGETKSYRGKKSYPDFICDKMKWLTQKTALIIDGGNVIRQGSTLIMADKVVWENRHHYTKTELVKAIETEFLVEKLVLLPWDEKYDSYGHSDSMVRFIDEETVLVNYYYDGDKELLGVLKKAGLNIEFIKLPGIKSNNDKYWPYLNFLQTEKCMLVTAIDQEHDAMILEQFEKHFPTYKGKMAGISMEAVTKEGGALNCISWTRA